MSIEEISGATVVFPDVDGAAAEAKRGPIVVGPEQNDGAYVVWVGAAPDGDPGPPLHIHPHTDEGFYIADGEMTFVFTDREVVGPSGSFVFIPRGVVHTARNTGGRPMRGLLILSPGRAEHITQPV